MEDVLKALTDDNLSMVSICGLGGVGKTTMVKELVKVVESRKLFDVVAMSVVSQNVNVEKIQGDIASDLGLKLDENIEKGRAHKLHERILTCEKMILLILDDVWNEIDFEEIGIPAADERKKCKIVLTSRRETVCTNMGSEKNFRIDALSNEEGWDLFKGIAFAGDSIDNQDLHRMAKQIAAECDGLPIAIVTVAKALKKRGESVWSDALNQLRRSNLKGVSGMGKVHSRLELSYDLLEREEAKSLFLLCCLFPEDYDIEVEDLVRYGMGLRLLENIDNIQQARDRVHALVDELKDSFLLLDSGKDDSDQYVKMHDVVRDMAISIASRQNSYIVSCNVEMKKWPETDQYENCHAISLQCKRMKEHPSDLKCPKLELVRLEYQKKGSEMLPDNFFNEMKKLKVLDISTSVLSDSIPFLEKLRTLYLSDLAKIGDVRNVEILTIRDKSFRIIPNEVGSMGKLRLLDLRGMSELQYIPKGVLSRLSNLEELYAGDFLQWESTVYNDDSDSFKGEVYASLDELKSLPLTSLQISVPEPSMLPKESVLANLVRFRIAIGKGAIPLDSIESENGLRLEGDASEIRTSGVCVLLKKAENLGLYGVKNLTSMWHELGNDDFTRLKRISVLRCGKLQNLVDIRHISSSTQLPCFSNLRDITIGSCDNLNYLFPVSMVRRLIQLRSINVSRCTRMNGFFYGKEEDYEVEFPNLIKLELGKLPHLEGLCVGMDNAATKISTSFLSHSIRLSNLQELVIKNCGLLKVAFSSSVVEQLVQLKTLKISFCEKMEYIVASVGEEDHVEKHTRSSSRSVFPMLTSIDFYKLPQLSNFFQDGNFFWDCHSLKDIRIDRCPKVKKLDAQTQTPSTSSITIALMKEVIPNESQTRSESSHSSRNWHVELTSILFWSTGIRLSNLQKIVLTHCHSVKVIFSTSVAEHLLHLQTLDIKECFEVECIVATLPGGEEEEEEEKHKRLIFPMLTTISISNLPELVTFCADTRVFLDWHSLKEIHVIACPKMKTLIEVNQNTSTLCQSRVSINEMISSSSFMSHSIRLSNLQEVVIDGCGLLKMAFSSSVVEQLVQLKTLKIRKCEQMEYIVASIGGEEEDTRSSSSRSVFPMLTSIDIYDLPQLANFCQDSNLFWCCHSLTEIKIESCRKMKTLVVQSETPSILFCSSSIQLSNLKKLFVRDCDSLKAIFSTNVAEQLMHLQSLMIGACKEVEYIVAIEHTKTISRLVFPMLTSIWVFELPQLVTFCADTNISLDWPSLKEITVEYCPKMKTPIEAHHGIETTSQIWCFHE